MSVIRWFAISSMVVGAPILAALMITGIERLTFTLTCESIRVGCERSFLRGPEWILETVERGEEVTAKRKK